MKKEIYDIFISKFGNKFKKYREDWDKAEKGEIIFNFPLHLNFELKIGCNLKCPACLCSLPFKKWPYDIDVKKEIKFNKFCEVIDEGVKHGLPSIELNGVNEPFLYKDIINCIVYSSQKGILHISLHTNALLLTEELSLQLIRSGLTNISFSLDACHEETYNRIRVGSNYKKVIKNIDNFLRMKKEMNSIFPLTRVSMVRSKVNYNEIEEFKNYWKSKVDIVSTSFFYNPFVGDSRYKQIEKEYRIEKNEYETCYEPYQRLFIFNNGNVAPCCSMFGGNLIVGNIYNDSIYNIWNNDKMKRIRQTIKNKETLPKPCKKCKIGWLGKDC